MYLHSGGSDGGSGCGSGGSSSGDGDSCGGWVGVRWRTPPGLEVGPICVLVATIVTEAYGVRRSGWWRRRLVVDSGLAVVVAVVV
jgi:hypothetical protein